MTSRRRKRSRLRDIAEFTGALAFYAACAVLPIPVATMVGRGLLGPLMRSVLRKHRLRARENLARALGSVNDL